MSFETDYLKQVNNFNTTKDHRSHNGRVSRLLRALAIELKDLPYQQQKHIDHIINDVRDGYKFNWLGVVDHNRAFIKG